MKPIRCSNTSTPPVLNNLVDKSGVVQPWRSRTGYTDGLDIGAKGEPGRIPSTPVGKTLATVSTLIPGASRPGCLDIRAPIISHEHKVWWVRVYTMSNAGPAMNQVKVTITPGAGDHAPPYLIHGLTYFYVFESPMVPGGEVIYSPYGQMPPSIAFTVDHPKTGFESADVLLLTVEHIPELSAGLVLVAGLAGLGGPARRRRR